MCKIKLITLLCVGALALAGCGEKEVTDLGPAIAEAEAKAAAEAEEEANRKLYAEYAATVLMKYNAGTNMRILEGKKLVNEEAREQKLREQEERRQQMAEEYQSSKKDTSDKKEDKGDKGSEDGSGSDAPVGTYVSNVAEAAGLGNFSITYQGYRLTDYYPDSGEAVLMSMEAAEGKTLIIAQFQVSNAGSESEILDMFNLQPKFKLQTSGGILNAQSTLLLDDLSMYRGEIAAGQSIDTVLIFEAKEEQAANMGNMELQITIGDTVWLMSLGTGTVADFSEMNDEVSTEDGIETGEDEAELSEEDADSHAETEAGGNVTVVGSGGNTGTTSSEESIGTTSDGTTKMDVSVDDYMESLEGLGSGL